MTACRFALLALVLTACRFVLVALAFSACEPPRSMLQCRDYELGMTHVHAHTDDAVKTPNGWVLQTSRGVEFWRSCTPCDCVRE